MRRAICFALTLGAGSACTLSASRVVSDKKSTNTTADQNLTKT